MKIIFISLIIFIFLTFFTSAQNEDVCNKVFYFLIANQGTYYNTDLMRFKYNSNFNFSLEELKNYTDQYESICSNINNRTLPFIRNNTKEVDYIRDIQNCSLSTNTSIIGYDFDYSLPIPEIEMQGKCEDFDKTKWFFKIKKDNYNFKINGLRLYLILIPLVLFFIFWIIKDTFRINKLMDKISVEKLNNKLKLV